MEEKIVISGYSYIDEELDNIKHMLPVEDQKKFVNLCKKLYSAGNEEGFRTAKKIVLEEK